MTHRSLQEKSNARLAAVQLLYKASVTGERLNPERLITDYQHYLEQNRDDPQAAELPKVPASIAYLRKLLEGYTAHGEALEPHIDAALIQGWSKQRTNPLLLAILRLALFELAHFEALKSAVIIDEYTTLASRFCGESEAGFVHGALNTMAQQLRG